MMLQAMTLKELLDLYHINPERAYVITVSATPIFEERVCSTKELPLVNGYKITCEFTIAASTVID